MVRFDRQHGAAHLPFDFAPHAVHVGLFISLSLPHRTGGLLLDSGAGLRRRVFLYVHFANCYPENRQSTANCTNCSFEPERYHLGTLSSFNHFPQLLVLVGLPTA